ncbi:MAG: DnaJ domain-containing protein [Psychrobium sp.]|nr:DnaJ domain-containing protein [Psychrobium sp.]
MEITTELPSKDRSSSLESHDNPLIWPLLSILKSENKSWKIHYLLSELKGQNLVDELDSDSEKDLFKRNFLIMNALYQLQNMLFPKQWLQVKSMDIRLMDWIPKGTLSEFNNDAPLREYYLDWTNYDASGDVIKEMLQSFWRKYTDYIGNEPDLCDREQALALFELSIDASKLDIRKRWSKLALRWHPDRPDGDSAKFREMCSAWQTLR